MKCGSLTLAFHIAPLRVKLATYGCLGLYVRIIQLVCRLSVFDRIFQLSSSSLLFVCGWSGWLVCFSCEIQLILVFFLLFFVQYGIPPKAVCLAWGILFDSLTVRWDSSIGSLVFMPVSGVRFVSFGSSSSKLVCTGFPSLLL